jgi:hypothetical protein
MGVDINDVRFMDRLKVATQLNWVISPYLFKMGRGYNWMIVLAELVLIHYSNRNQGDV